MRPRPRLTGGPRWRDYLGLALFLGLLTIPFPVAASVAAGLVAGRIGLAVRRRARIRRSAARAGPGRERASPSAATAPAAR